MTSEVHRPPRRAPQPAPRSAPPVRNGLVPPAGTPGTALTLALALAVTLAVTLALAGCGTGRAADGTGTGPIAVVAAEDVWGGVAAQLGGRHVSVTSIISGPDVDPHDYEPRARDARAVASAAYVIVNGAGYDAWASKLLAAGGSQPAVLDVGRLVGVRDGANPHRWYSPPDVAEVVARITSDYKRLDPGDAASFDRLRSSFESTGLARYTSLVEDIRRTYRGTAIGASESIVAPLAGALGLDLVTPESFLDAVSEGTEPTARDKATADAQIASGRIKAYVFNRQNSTPDVRAQVRAAKAAGIPVVSVTETPPAMSSFQDWQANQLEGLRAALATATGAGA